VYIPRIVVTSGEPAGIGPDICVALAHTQWDADIVVAGDAGLLSAAADALKLPLTIELYDSAERTAPRRTGPVTTGTSADVPLRAPARTLKVLHIPTPGAVIAGQLDTRNAAYVIDMLDRACDGCTNGEFAAMVTAPVQKSVLLDAGFAFTGHTEYLAARTRAALPVMLLQTGSLRVALVTTHLALADVPRAITRERLRSTLRIVNFDMERHFSLDQPRIAVLGLNPHAGEAGHLGREEIDVIQPVIEELRAEGMTIRGPVPADTAFTPHFLQTTDVIVAMYHDQGLPVIKHVGFGDAVNVTLGLPILRTSVDHGTALALARSGNADAGSLRAALRLAIDLAGTSSVHARS
jgi:4-hydroxythreonine-4-phosphate dehydrogenase